MPDISITNDTVTIHFGGFERIFTGHASVAIPIVAIRDVETHSNVLPLARGGQMGFRVSGMRKIGTWGLGTGRRQLTCARRGPGVRITLDAHTSGTKYDELVLSHPDPVAFANTLMPRIRRPQGGHASVRPAGR